MRSRFARAAAVLPLLLLTLVAASCGKGKSNPTGSNPGNTTELNSGVVPPSGGLFSHRFTAAGSYPYHCSIHTGMHGTVTVSASAPAGDSVQAVLISGFTFTPPSVTIPVNGNVTWTNSDNTNHTVTSD